MLISPLSESIEVASWIYSGKFVVVISSNCFGEFFAEVIWTRSRKFFPQARWICSGKFAALVILICSGELVAVFKSSGWSGRAELGIWSEMRYDDFEDSGMKDLLQGVYIETGFVGTSFAIFCFLGDWVIENLYNFWSWISGAFNNSRYSSSWTFSCLLRKCSSNLFRTASRAKRTFFRFSIFFYTTFSFP